MSAHFVRRHLRNKPLTHRSSPSHTMPTTSQIHHLNRPHTTNEFKINSTHLEAILLAMALLALLALVIWLAWLALRHCIGYVQGTMDELNLGKQTKKNVERAEEVPKKVFRLGWTLGRAAKGCLDGFLVGKRAERAREGERRGLLRENGGREVYVQGYGYDRERYGDGTSDNVSTRTTSLSMDHREDCDGNCGLTSRRWSGDA